LNDSIFSVPIRQITIVGTGLIGGSLGLALRKKGFKGKIIGCDQPEVLRVARKIKAIDQGIVDPIKACHGSNLVVLATPVGTIIDLIERLAHIRENLDSRQLEDEFNLAHKLTKADPPRSHGDTEMNKKKEKKSS
jgi:hypothetical protein